MKTYIFLVIISLAIQSINSKIQWKLYLSGKGNEMKIELTNGGLSSTTGLKVYTFVSILILEDNTLAEIGEIQFLNNLKRLISVAIKYSLYKDWRS